MKQARLDRKEIDVSDLGTAQVEGPRLVFPTFEGRTSRWRSSEAHRSALMASPPLSAY